jgi:putative heme iron utilization protein
MKSQPSSSLGEPAARVAPRIELVPHSPRDAVRVTRRRMQTKSRNAETLERFARWRQTLKRLETEASKHGFSEIEVLAGVARLAVDDLIKVSTGRGGSPWRTTIEE